MGVTGLTGMNFEGVLLPEEGGAAEALSLTCCVLSPHMLVTIENHSEKRGEEGPLKATQRLPCKEVGSKYTETASQPGLELTQETSRI